MFLLFPLLFAMKWWDRMPGSLFFWMLSFKPAFHSPLSSLSSGSLVYNPHVYYLTVLRLKFKIKMSIEFFLEAPGDNSFYLPFLASRGLLHSLAHGFSFCLQSQQLSCLQHPPPHPWPYLSLSLSFSLSLTYTHTPTHTDIYTEKDSIVIPPTLILALLPSSYKDTVITLESAR